MPRILELRDSRVLDLSFLVSYRSSSSISSNINIIISSGSSNHRHLLGAGGRAFAFRPAFQFLMAIKAQSFPISFHPKMAIPCSGGPDILFPSVFKFLITIENNSFSTSFQPKMAQKQP